jgi:hypothetical protein
VSCSTQLWSAPYVTGNFRVQTPLRQHASITFIVYVWKNGYLRNETKTHTHVRYAEPRSTRGLSYLEGFFSTRPKPYSDLLPPLTTNRSTCHLTLHAIVAIFVRPNKCLFVKCSVSAEPFGESGRTLGYGTM